MAVTVPMINISALLLERPDMDAGVVQQLRTALAEAASQFAILRSAADTLEDHLRAGKGDSVKTTLKLGIANALPSGSGGSETKHILLLRLLTGHEARKYEQQKKMKTTHD